LVAAAPAVSPPASQHGAEPTLSFDLRLLPRILFKTATKLFFFFAATRSPPLLPEAVKAASEAAVGSEASATFCTIFFRSTLTDRSLFRPPPALPPLFGHLSDSDRASCFLLLLPCRFGPRHNEWEGKQFCCRLPPAAAPRGVGVVRTDDSSERPESRRLLLTCGLSPPQHAALKPPTSRALLLFPFTQEPGRLRRPVNDWHGLEGVGK
jgi:hypothetical protein